MAAYTARFIIIIIFLEIAISSGARHTLNLRIWNYLYDYVDVFSSVT